MKFLAEFCLLVIAIEHTSCNLFNQYNSGYPPTAGRCETNADCPDQYDCYKNTCYDAHIVFRGGVNNVQQNRQQTQRLPVTNDEEWDEQNIGNQDQGEGKYNQNAIDQEVYPRYQRGSDPQPDTSDNIKKDKDKEQSQYQEQGKNGSSKINTVLECFMDKDCTHNAFCFKGKCTY